MNVLDLSIANVAIPTIAGELGVSARVVVKTAAEFAAALSGNPFAKQAADASRLLVVFTQQHRELAALGALAPLAKAPEQFALGKHAAYLHCPDGVLASKVGAALLGKAGGTVTTRNQATCLKLQTMLDDRRA